jgi:hypothetical protein
MKRSVAGQTELRKGAWEEPPVTLAHSVHECISAWKISGLGPGSVVAHHASDHTNIALAPVGPTGFFSNL